MKLLIVTQAVDINHPILGFFHRWIEEFSKHCEQVTVICLQKGEHSLPENVKVLSLGKESGTSKMRQLLRFYCYIWNERKNYDHVFVHMNPSYVMLAGPLWRLLCKRIGLWYTHGTVSVTLRLATLFTHKIFTASEESFMINSPKKYVTGHGIDMQVFKSTNKEKTIDLITVGRISPVKNIQFLIEVLTELAKKYPVTLTVVGSPIDESGGIYQKELVELVKRLGISGKVFFTGPATQAELPGLLNRSKVFVTASKTGSLDKVMLEAMACGLPVVSSAEGSRALPLQMNQVSSTKDFASAVIRVLESGNYYEGGYVSYVEQEHDLALLISKISRAHSYEIQKTG